MDMFIPNMTIRDKQGLEQAIHYHCLFEVVRCVSVLELGVGVGVELGEPDDDATGVDPAVASV